MKDKFKIAVCQTNVFDDKNKNILNAETTIKEAYDNSADIIILPEMFNCKYEMEAFDDYAESVRDGVTIKSIANISKELGVYVVAGSIPEVDDGNIYNSCFVFDRSGHIIARYRKIHLFDIDIPGKIVFKESEAIKAGKDIVVFDTEFCKIGIAICYDIRFPELMRLMALKGANLIVVPAAFNMTTGPAHWELLMRARAVDNQVFVAAASPARNEKASYIAYGNSMVVNPWGDVICRASENREIIYAEIEQNELERVRRELPLKKHIRKDVYELKFLSENNKGIYN